MRTPAVDSRHLHEAAHCVISLYLGARVERLTTSVCYFDASALAPEMVHLVALAGAAGEGLAGEAGEPSDTDLALCRDGAGRGTYLRNARRAAESLTWKLSAEIAWLARKLAARGYLNQAALAGLVWELNSPLSFGRSLYAKPAAAPSPPAGAARPASKPPLPGLRWSPTHRCWLGPRRPVAGLASVNL